MNWRGQGLLLRCICSKSSSAVLCIFRMSSPAFCLMCDCLPCAEEACHHLQKKKDLTAAEGHVVLLEYLEERPLLLSRPGETLSPCILLVSL